jgi:hypothetical protein
LLNPAPSLCRNAGLCFLLAAVASQTLGLFRAVTAKTTITPQLPADGRFMDAQHICNLRLGMFGFQQRLNLVSLFDGSELP